MVKKQGLSKSNKLACRLSALQIFLFVIELKCKGVATRQSDSVPVYVQSAASNLAPKTFSLKIIQVKKNERSLLHSLSRFMLFLHKQAHKVMCV